MNPIPWYKSPLYIGIWAFLITTILSHVPGLAAQLGLIDKASINTAATDTLQWLGVFAGLIAERLRARSKLQPLTLSQKAADAKTTPDSQSVTDLHSQLTAGGAVPLDPTQPKVSP